MTPTEACWICGGRDRKPVWRDPFDLSAHPRFGPYAHADNPDSVLVRCQSCGFGQPAALPAVPDYFDTLYGDQPWLTEESMRVDYDRGLKDLLFAEVLAILKSRLGPDVPRTLLDVGTYIGRFLELASASGFQSERIELNRRAADFAAKRTSCLIHRIKAQDLAVEGRRFGAVTMIDVLEHIPEPAPIVSALRELLIPGGVLVVKVPHGPMQLLKERLRGLLIRSAKAREARNIGVMTRFVHVNHFTVGSLRACLENAGFTAVRIATAAPDFQEHVGSRNLPSRLRAWNRLAVYRLAKSIPMGVHTPLSLHLLAEGTVPRANGFRASRVGSGEVPEGRFYWRRGRR
jgi:SAM-dependent methyltransferase